jgi:hypothetical protein
MALNQIVLVLCFLITTDAAWAFGKKAPDASSGAASQPDTVWIKRSDGAKQCDPTSAQDVKAGARELSKSGIEVLEARKGHDEIKRIQLCGAPNGTENAYKIRKSDLPKATSLGFKE